MGSGREWNFVPGLGCDYDLRPYQWSCGLGTWTGQCKMSLALFFFRKGVVTASPPPQGSPGKTSQWILSVTPVLYTPFANLPLQ